MNSLMTEMKQFTHTETALPPGYTARPARREDLEEVVGLINAACVNVIGEPTFSTSRLGSEWEMPGFDLEGDSQVVVAENGSLAGYFDVFDLSEPHVRIYAWGQVHPAHSGKGIASAMLAWCEERARRSITKAPDEARVALLGNIFSGDRRAARAHQKQGFSLVRHSLRMVIELDGEIPEPVWPAGIRLKHFVLGQDDEITVHAVRDSFADHWGHVPRPFEDDLARYRHFWQTDEDFDPSLNYLAMDGEEAAGISLCIPKVEEDSEMGWVGTLGVRRPWRRKGLGLALLLHSFHEFKKRGKARVGLGVDAESLTGATRLYEKAGMHPAPEWQWSIFEKELRPGVDLSRQTLEG